MNNICPTILTSNPDTFGAYMQHLAKFAVRVHIDLADGQFAPTQSIPLENVWWPGGIRADLHMMYVHPMDHLEILVDLAPQMVIVHAEADGDFEYFAGALHHYGIEVGVALLPQTPVEAIAPALHMIDHVLIFSGNLGRYGGTPDLSLLEKARQLRSIKPTIEIGWDGGVNAENVKTIYDGGVDVLNVGGYIARSSSPAHAYATLERAILNQNHYA